jgi:transglutaminase-like putative cysteine protease
VQPAAERRMLGALAVAVALAVVLTALGAVGRPARVLGGVLASAVALGAVLAVAGAPLRLLAPGSWSGLGDGLRQGIDALFDVRIPYQGDDPWPAIAILGGGGLLLAIAALATFGPRHGRLPETGRGVALLALGGLYVVPAVDVPGSHQFLRGAAFAALVAAFLWLDRVPARGAPAALAWVAAAVTAGLALAPSLDRGRPWVDYESLARDLARGGSVAYDFDHTYGPLDWPRTGRELLRISAPRETYWKAENLDDFDGVRWERSRDTFGGAAPLQGQLPDSPVQVRRWRERVRVTVRGLRTNDVVGAGTLLGVRGTPSAAVTTTAPGTLRVESPLGRDDSYLADVYTPRPTPRQLAAAGSAYPSQLGGSYLSLQIPLRRPPPAGRSRILVRFGAFGSGAPAQTMTFVDGLAVTPAEFALRDSPYAAAYALARRLAARSRTPYELVQRVLAYLGQPTFVYSEIPVESRYPLETFLFRSRVGYCQHFSGAMALLLRMAGVPARVVGGFSPGTYDRRRREWVVRDYDAHSWVEAYFPGYGWVTFDPTPADSPARSQLIPINLPASPTGALRADRIAQRGDRPEPGAPASLSAAGDTGKRGAPVARIALAVALLVGAGLVGVLLGAGSVRRRPVATVGGELAELERALRRSGRPAAAGSTLRGLEGRFGRDPDAVGYLRALADRRFGLAGAGPSAAQRRALRRALARGLGPAGRLRALWALPPRPGRRGLRP